MWKYYLYIYKFLLCYLKIIYFSRYNGVGYAEIVDIFIKSGAAPNLTDSFGVPALMLAVECRSPETVEVLLKYNPEVNFKSKGMTPLIMAAGLAEPEITKMLLDQGADIHAKDTMGNTALINAVGVGVMIHRSRAFKTSKLLIEHGANINDIGYDSMNVLQFAVEMGVYDIIKHLLENGANLKHKDKNGRIAISIAKEGYNNRVLSLLKEYEKR